MAEAKLQTEPLCPLTFYCSGREASGRPGSLQGFLLFSKEAAKKLTEIVTFSINR